MVVGEALKMRAKLHKGKKIMSTWAWRILPQPNEHCGTCGGTQEECVCEEFDETGLLPWELE
jgi:hypothetical protein